MQKRELWEELIVDYGIDKSVEGRISSFGAKIGKNIIQDQKLSRCPRIVVIALFSVCFSDELDISLPGILGFDSHKINNNMTEIVDQFFEELRIIHNLSKFTFKTNGFPLSSRSLELKSIHQIKARQEKVGSFTKELK